MYKWNLDFVVDARGNSMRIFYNKSAASYSRNNGQAVTYYEYNAVPQAIEYGYRATDAPGSSGQMRVEFTTDNRCNPNGCQVDVPWDQFCAQAATSCPHTSPTFFTPYGLDLITTKVWNNDAGAYQDVDRYDLVHSYPGTTDGTTSSLWLSTLTRTGVDGANTTSEPTLEFWGDLRDNRVDHDAGNGVPPLRKFRLGYLLDNAGSRTTVTYNAGDCTASTLPTRTTTRNAASPSTSR
ncbi:hypothetical protein [Virgisporangium aurantiacum]|uniref:Uncharacterized protein n=1 Tax=Virgisporangium aurantiacum TaxID=175570 RepID=A0A8J4EA53_9ACTN|nr:hypothetical protein [Virgisporangium aurantiacum]GIJ64407.1 hypothetical protein Vau01_119230 [Virgisporangium aurantiacum]